MGFRGEVADIYRQDFNFLTDIYGIGSKMIQFLAVSFLLYAYRNIRIFIGKDTDIYRQFFLKIWKMRTFMGYTRQKKDLKLKRLSSRILKNKSHKSPLNKKIAPNFAYICHYVNLYLYIIIKVLTNWGRNCGQNEDFFIDKMRI